MENIGAPIGNVAISKRIIQITTDNEGKKGLFYDDNKSIFVLSLKGPDSILLIPFYYNGYWWVKALSNGNSYTPMANKTMGITCLIATVKS